MCQMGNLLDRKELNQTLGFNANFPKLNDFVLAYNKFFIEKYIWRVAKKWRIFNVVDIRVDKIYINILSFLKNVHTCRKTPLK